MTINTDRYIEKLIEEINKTHVCYYEEAPKGVSYPYITLSSIQVYDNRYGDQINFDLEIWSTEYTNQSVETLSDDLRNALDMATVNDEGYFNSHINFETLFTIKDPEQDLICRRLSFIARIFYK